MAAMAKNPHLKICARSDLEQDILLEQRTSGPYQGIGKSFGTVVDWIEYLAICPEINGILNSIVWRKETIVVTARPVFASV